MGFCGGPVDPNDPDGHEWYAWLAGLPSLELFGAFPKLTVEATEGMCRECAGHEHARRETAEHLPHAEPWPATPPCTHPMRESAVQVGACMGVHCLVRWLATGDPR